MKLWTYKGPIKSLETLLQCDRENRPHMVKFTYSLSSVHQPECYRGIILFPLDNIKISIRERDLSLIGRNPEWKFEIQNCRGQGPTAIILPAVAETELESTFNQSGWTVSRRPPTQTFVCLLGSFHRIPWRQVLWGLKNSVWGDLLLAECFFFCRYLPSIVLQFFNWCLFI